MGNFNLNMGNYGRENSNSKLLVVKELKKVIMQKQNYMTDKETICLINHKLNHLK